MVGDWQHAEGPLMLARMSDKTERGLRPRVSDCMMLALDEARSILAETEPVDCAWYRMRAHHATGWGSLEALAESLRSFVEGN